MDIIQTLAQELSKEPRHVENVVQLLDEGNTIPFIARYRKELHGAMDDTSLRTLAAMRGDADAERFFIDYFVELDPYTGHPALTEIANSFWN